MKRLVPLLYLLVSVVSFSILTEEQSRAFLSEAIKLWSEGKYAEASLKMDDAMTGSISAREIPWFWYVKAKIDVYNDQVDAARENLKTLLTITNIPEIMELYKKIEVFNSPENFEVKEYKLKFVNSVSGKEGLTEYFYSPVGLAVFGEKVYVIDKKNKRLIVLDDFKMSNIIKLPYNPRSIAVDSFGKVYISSEDSIYTLENQQPIYTGLKSPIIAGVDRANRLVVVDASKIYIFSDRVIEKNLPLPTIALDCDINYENLYILDAFSNQILVYNLYTLELKDKIKLKDKIWSFEVTPAGQLIYFDGNKIIAGESEFKINSTPMFIEYSYPHLFVVDWKSDTINWYLLKDDLPIFVKVESFETSDATLTAHVCLENYFGDDIYLAKDFLNIYEEDVKEFAQIEGEQDTVYPTTDISKSLLTDRFLGKVIVKNDRWKFTGGAPIDFEKRGKFKWKITYNYAKIFPLPLVKVSVKFEVADEKFTDIFVYTEEVVNGGEANKGD
ncbi:conserved hypothetical protein [Thermosipho africanus TCF52B]|uniref:Uncharacterized protein n=1 Tax=Thermosipho africanus (strain TCF52B) TaxID=484019 RepID=B7IH29_THEAB|nr:hypothetical protein [Thermosipho africanus]ACJ75393.1 conserved hypothetical protein [Thermosipho africanus TCF52B]